jgi:hypothetical protein
MSHRNFFISIFFKWKISLSLQEFTVETVSRDPSLALWSSTPFKPDIAGSEYNLAVLWKCAFKILPIRLYGYQGGRCSICPQFTRYFSIKVALCIRFADICELLRRPADGLFANNLTPLNFKCDFVWQNRHQLIWIHCHPSNLASYIVIFCHSALIQSFKFEVISWSKEWFL